MRISCSVSSAAAALLLTLGGAPALAYDWTIDNKVTTSSMIAGAPATTSWEARITAGSGAPQPFTMRLNGIVRNADDHEGRTACDVVSMGPGDYRVCMVEMGTGDQTSVILQPWAQTRTASSASWSNVAPATATIVPFASWSGTVPMKTGA